MTDEAKRATGLHSGPEWADEDPAPISKPGTGSMYGIVSHNRLGCLPSSWCEMTARYSSSGRDPHTRFCFLFKLRSNQYSTNADS
jgi:hypothetical protein